MKFNPSHIATSGTVGESRKKFRIGQFHTQPLESAAELLRDEAFAGMLEI
jgi:hypothetical protein